MHRQISQLIDRQERWAKPLGEWVQHWLGSVFAERRRVKDFLNGTWLGHPVHPAVTDVPVGAMTLAAVLDLVGQGRAADIAVTTGIAGMAASAATGAADAADTYGRSQIRATVHATLMASSLAAYAASLGLRAGPRSGRSLAKVLALVGYGALGAGAYVGGELTYRLGNQVDRHAFRSAGTKWGTLDITEVAEEQLIKAGLGAETLVVFRVGDQIEALHATCSHAGGPLDKGTIVDDCVECPWHQSRFRLTDGQVVHGPAVYEQPVYEVRRTEGGGLEARRTVRH